MGLHGRLGGQGGQGQDGDEEDKEEILLKDRYIGVNSQNFGLLSRDNFDVNGNIVADEYSSGMLPSDYLNPFHPMDKEGGGSFARVAIDKERRQLASLRRGFLETLDSYTKVNKNNKNNKNHRFHLGMGALTAMKEDPFLGEIQALSEEKTLSIYDKYKQLATSLFDTFSSSSSSLEKEEEGKNEENIFQNL